MKRKKKVDSTENWSYKNDFPIEEVWNTYCYIAKAIVPRLKAFKALDKHGCPEDFFPDENKWNKAIQKMIDAFELLQPHAIHYQVDEPTIEEGLDLFRKHFLNLWD